MASKYSNLEARNPVCSERSDRGSAQWGIDGKPFVTMITVAQPLHTTISKAVSRNLSLSIPCSQPIKDMEAMLRAL